MRELAGRSEGASRFGHIPGDPHSRPGRPSLGTAGAGPGRAGIRRGASRSSRLVDGHRARAARGRHACTDVQSGIRSARVHADAAAYETAGRGSVGNQAMDEAAFRAGVCELVISRYITESSKFEKAAVFRGFFAMLAVFAIKRLPPCYLSDRHPSPGNLLVEILTGKHTVIFRRNKKNNKTNGKCTAKSPKRTICAKMPSNKWMFSILSAARINVPPAIHVLFPFNFTRA
ncbi:MAG: hypothetical protein K0R28_5926 [Paenibacillus sp.]|nr:hypothetical protein [Paenibacillus sp.]